MKGSFGSFFLAHAEIGLVIGTKTTASVLSGIRVKENGLKY